MEIKAKLGARGLTLRPGPPRPIRGSDETIHGLPRPADAPDDARRELRRRAGVVQICRHQAQADLQKMIDAGMGDVPLTRLRFRCSNCRSSLTDFVCTGRTAIGVQPWQRPAARG